MGSVTAPRQAVAIVSPRNGPIYARQFDQTGTSSSAADLRYHYFAHAALDVIEERSGISSSGQVPKATEQYLGLLYTLEDLAIYGFQTSTRLRFILIMSLTDHIVRDIDILTLFRAFQTAYLRYSANPFHVLGPQSLSSPSVDSGPMDALAAQSALQRQHEAHLPINCRSIRSASFDDSVDRIFLRRLLTEKSGSTNTAALQTRPPGVATAPS
ncbi:Sedlin [Testicularia cyperi]|uniref:Trafficking protein particle complex subunit 2-like protein n=1 Tax=Testicularia cyperi TaxID=1882483 RepID=A0A317XII3_9BASI|nr:Sedlin [Testicularia cyperi]